MKSKVFEKEFYAFLVRHGMLFQFLDMLQKTKYKTLKQHCRVNHPFNYIENACIYSAGIINWGVWGGLGEEWDKIVLSLINKKPKK